MKSALILASLLASLPAFAAPSVSFVGLKDGDTVSSPVKVKMALEGMKLRKAGEDNNDTHSGHFHILVDTALVEKGQVIPADATHLHFGKAQEEAELTLAPGKHTLTLLLADGAHRSYGKDLSQTVHIEVKK
jgi:Domain of unknown function (DUF4399)